MSAPTFWVAPPLRKTLVAGVADMVASNDRTSELVTYSLGSCLGVVIYDPVTRAGGLLHLMLPDSSLNPSKAKVQPCMFVDTGVPQLFHTVYGLGGDRSRLTLRVAGGAQFLDEKGVFNIGARNLASIAALLARTGVRIEAADVGGRVSRTIRLDLATGKLIITVPGRDPYSL